MASTIIVPHSLTQRPLIQPNRIRFLTSRIRSYQWIEASSNDSCNPRFSRFYYSHSHSSYHPISIFSGFFLLRNPLHSLCGPGLPYLRDFLSHMTTAQASSDSDQGSVSTKTVRAVIKGRVQGVFYRNWTVENATQLGLKGWVRNRRDGSVEAVFSGSSDAVNEMEQRCRRGPPDAMVTGIQVFPSNDDPGTGFELKPTV